MPILHSSGSPNNFIFLTIKHWLGPLRWLTHIGHVLDLVGSYSWILLLLSVILWVFLEQMQIKSPIWGIQLKLNPHLLSPPSAEDLHAALSSS